MYEDQLTKFTLAYSNASGLIDCIFVVSLLVEQPYILTEHSIDEFIVRPLL